VSQHSHHALSRRGQVPAFAEKFNFGEFRHAAGGRSTWSNERAAQLAGHVRPELI
jgi:hypothetical protein